MKDDKKLVKGRVLFSREQIQAIAEAVYDNYLRNVDDVKNEALAEVTQILKNLGVEFRGVELGGIRVTF